MTERTTAREIAAELGRQVDHQVTAMTSIDTKAAGLIAGTFALFALVVPRIVVSTPAQLVVGVLTLGLVIATLAYLARAIRPRTKSFSYGPDGTEMLAFLDDQDPVATLDDAIARVYVDVFDVET